MGKAFDFLLLLISTKLKQRLNACVLQVYVCLAMRRQNMRISPKSSQRTPL